MRILHVLMSYLDSKELGNSLTRASQSGFSSVCVDLSRLNTAMGNSVCGGTKDVRHDVRKISTVFVQGPVWPALTAQALDVIEIMFD